MWRSPDGRHRLGRSGAALSSERLTFAVGNPNGEEARFAAKLAAVLNNTSSRLRTKIVSNADVAKALAQFDRREADLVVLRTDAKVPARARALRSSSMI